MRTFKKTTQVGQRFDALSLTLEMPFKDNAGGNQSSVPAPRLHACALALATLHMRPGGIHMPQGPGPRPDAAHGRCPRTALPTCLPHATWAQLALTHVHATSAVNADLPDAVHGWSPQRSARLGAAMLGAVLEVAPHLR